MKMKGRRVMKKNVVIVILVILVLGLGGYLAYDKVLSKKEVKKEKTEMKEVVKEEAYNLDSARNIVSKYLNRNPWYSEEEIKSLISDNFKGLLAIENTKPTNEQYECKKAFTNMDSTNLVEDGNNHAGECIESSVLAKEPEESSMSKYYYRYSDVNESYKKLFGETEEAPKTFFQWSVYRYAYSEAYDAYIKLDCRCGGRPILKDYYDVVSATKNNDELSITIGYLLFEQDEDSDRRVEDPNGTISVYKYVGKNETYKVETEDGDMTDQQMKEVYNKEVDNLPKYELKFKRHSNSDDYYFVSMKKK